jgi:hypothetical protein
LLIVKYALHSNDICSIRGRVTDSSHDCNEHVLLNSERTGRELGAEYFDVRQDACEAAAKRKRDKLCYEAPDCDGRVTEEAAKVESLTRQSFFKLNQKNLDKKEDAPTKTG